MVPQNSHYGMTGAASSVSVTPKEAGSEGMLGSEGLCLRAKAQKDPQGNCVRIPAPSTTGTRRKPLIVPSFDSYLDMGMTLSGLHLPLGSLTHQRGQEVKRSILLVPKCKYFEVSARTCKEILQAGNH